MSDSGQPVPRLNRPKGNFVLVIIAHINQDATGRLSVTRQKVFHR